MTSQRGKQITAIQILPNISKDIGNQRMKFGQLEKYNMKNIFIGKYFTKYWRNYSQTHFLNIRIERISESLV